jgi:hypothetical protein
MAVTHHEQGVVCSGGNDSDLDPVFWVPAGISVKDIDVLPGVEVINSSFTVDLESVLAAGQCMLKSCVLGRLTPS